MAPLMSHARIIPRVCAKAHKMISHNIQAPKLHGGPATVFNVMTKKKPVDDFIARFADRGINKV